MEDFIDSLSKALLNELPGAKAHAEMVSIRNRPIITPELIKEKQPRYSGVMCLLYPIDEEIHIALIKRPTYSGTHSAQVSFPGGKMEEDDKNLLETAQRETWEEIGVSSNQYEILGELTSLYIPPSNFLVKPFVGFCNQQPAFDIDDYEVAQVFDFPLEYLLNDTNVNIQKIPISQGFIQASGLRYDGKLIWGATLMILNELKVLVKSFY